jgi:YHS domain-containing protein
VRKINALILALTLVAFAAGAVWAATGTKTDPPAITQTKCPVLGGDINKQVYADSNGKRIYFCCNGCDGQFKQNPEKYMKKLEEAGVTPEPSPAGTAK